MSWFPFKFCRQSTAKRLDKLECDMECLQAYVRLVDKLHGQTRATARRTARELAYMIRDAAGKGGAS